MPLLTRRGIQIVIFAVGGHYEKYTTLNAHVFQLTLAFSCSACKLSASKSQTPKLSINLFSQRFSRLSQTSWNENSKLDIVKCSCQVSVSLVRCHKQDSEKSRLQ